MTEVGKETQTETLRPRESPIVDEILEEYILQINHGQRQTQPLQSSWENPTTLDELQHLAKIGASYTIAVTIARYEISDETARSLLAEALDNKAYYLSKRPVLRAVFDPHIRGGETLPNVFAEKMFKMLL
ncbi:hypothetical protein A2Z23_01250 [Candidatus Curtissbacteria bacterium RBG_16_39_7]|uniref:Uncharacterized protein n=1 Tax=Candidatus Curtissbacteria bacterium RBG_16_39_7 TaxID=1797707 RepID=A0A1F5G2B3_9BACT|nr:MAG: hypothetical protein A2Z23_01250 [Candidatus Curtissbacteria bacterium RBG_16_39_7]